MIIFYCTSFAFLYYIIAVFTLHLYMYFVYINLNSIYSLARSIWIISWWRIVFAEWLTYKSCLAFFPARTIVRDSHHCKSLTRREQDLNPALNVNLGFIESTCAVVATTTPLHHYTCHIRFCEQGAKLKILHTMKTIFSSHTLRLFL